jgi:signal transduction histidine kinase
MRESTRGVLRWSLLLAVAWTLIGLLSLVQWWAQAGRGLGPYPGPSRVARLFLDIWLWAAYTPAILWLAARFPLEERRAWAQRLPVHLAAALGTALLDAAAFILVQPALGPHPSPGYLGFLSTGAMLSVLSYTAVLALGHALRYHRLWLERQVRGAELERQLALTRLQALTAQLRPHFLFNALHTVGALVRAGESQTAIRTLASLGDLLRLSLRDGLPEVALRDELAFAARYLEVEGTRFRGRLDFRLKVAPAVEGALVPRFLLQPLVENAVRHGIEPCAAPGHVEIRVQREGGALSIEVRDSGPGLGASEPGGGVGLANTRERLRRLYGARQRLELEPVPGGGTRVRIELPFHLTESEVAA